ncbi:MAG TPA: plastocyanin/azurin family copper-binding protein [Polyangia bacterium]|jgi:plastocyanin
MILRRIAIAALMVGAIAVGATVAAQPPQDQPAAVIKMTSSRRFDPAQVTIKVGQTVEWINTTDQVHTVTDDPRRAHAPADATLPQGAQPFNSGSLKRGQTFRHTFTVPGTYRYFCLPHEEQHMVGVVVVQP